MSKRIVVFLAISLVLISFLAISPVASSRLSPTGLLLGNSVTAKSGYETSLPAKHENALLRGLKAPFRAIGKLFGRGAKDDKPQRLSEKDVRKFERSPMNRVNNTTTTRSAPPDANLDPIASNHLESGRKLLDDGNLNEAIRELSTALSLDPKLSDAHTQLGIAFDRKGLPEQARRSFEAALHAPDDQAMHLNNLGYLEYRNGDYKGAIKHLKRAAELAPNDPTIWNNLGLAQADSGKTDDACKSFVHSVGEFYGRLNIATRLESYGSWNDAIKQLEKARALQPTSAVVLARLITLYERTDRRERAQEARNALAESTVAKARPE